MGVVAKGRGHQKLAKSTMAATAPVVSSLASSGSNQFMLKIMLFAGPSAFYDIQCFGLTAINEQSEMEIRS